MQSWMQSKCVDLEAKILFKTALGMLHACKSVFWECLCPSCPPFPNYLAVQIMVNSQQTSIFVAAVSIVYTLKIAKNSWYVHIFQICFQCLMWVYKEYSFSNPPPTPRHTVLMLMTHMDVYQDNIYIYKCF